ncbi:tRNA-uridine aminocarboxypropyltransferase [uncultured Alsobacter sp.]|uniref:tRNA-uridine aminocarboxypropyltransferase n=1 Tax=uncultured Alsobacter sp. TaxID=1748258 RepID=UPI0025FCC11D|nr:tRNA-uridine aminocarboxypropyltransferase [uncultured Alsobacter sp.]
MTSPDDQQPVPVPDPLAPCPHCAKPAPLCVCEAVTPVESRLTVLILQHPQEQDRLLGTARLAARYFDKAVFRVGLSWPSLSKALGRDADPARWAVLHLGAMRGADLPPDREVVVFDRKGVMMPDQDAALDGLEGIVAFDGTWSQAKTLWWRNAWVLKARRLVLNPRQPSLYGRLRREPRREGLSTIEAIGLAVSAVERRPEIRDTLRTGFTAMLDRYRDAAQASDEGQVASLIREAERGATKSVSARRGGHRRGWRAPAR